MVNINTNLKPAEDNRQRYVGTWVYNKRGDHFEICCNNEGKLVFEETSSSRFSASDLHPVGGGWLEARLQCGGCVRFLRGHQDERMFSVWKDAECEAWSSTLVARLFPPKEMSSSKKAQARQSPEYIGTPPGLSEPVLDADTFVDSLITACSMSENVARTKPFQQKLLDVEAPCCDYFQGASQGLHSNGSCWSNCEYPSVSSELSAPRSMEFGEFFEASLFQ